MTCDGADVRARNRLARAPRPRLLPLWRHAVWAVTLFGVLSALSWHYLTTPAGFIGGPPSPAPIG